MAPIYELIPDFPIIGQRRSRREWFVRFAIHEIARSSMRDGMRLLEPFPDIVGVGESGPVEVPDYLLSLNGWSLFSERFKVTIEGAFPEAMQFIPFRLSADASVVRSGDYFIGQVLHVVNAIDFERTTPTKDWTRRANGTYDIDSFRPIYVVERLTKGCPIFRLDGERVCVWVNAAFRKLVEDNDITGCRFRPAHVS